MRAVGWSLVVVVGLAVVTVGAAMCGLVSRGVSAGNDPTWGERVVARQMRHLAIPRDARSRENPVPTTAEVLAEARAHFADHCAVCHDNDGSGRTEIGQGMYPKPPDMRLAATQDLSDGELFFIIENGVRLTGMPAFGTGGTSGERASWELVRFIRHLPDLTPDELAEMRRLNPKSEADREEERLIEEFLRGEDPAGPEPDHEGDQHD